VQIPTARTNWVEETRTAQVPVTTYRTVPEEYTSRVAVSVPPGTPSTNLQGSAAPASVANRPHGTQMPSDPPRNGTGWTNPYATGAMR
jgi:hypothetical protein